MRLFIDLLDSFTRKNYDSVIDKINEKKYELNCIFKNGETPLMFACNTKNYKLVQAMLLNEADPNMKDAEGRTPLMESSRRNCIEISTALLSHGANPDIKDPNRNSALIIATNAGHSKMVDLLISNGADVNITDNMNQTPIINASKYGYLTIIQNLISKGGDVNFMDILGNTALTYSFFKNHTRVFHLLLKNGADINRRDRLGSTILHYACKSYTSAHVNKLLRCGADPHIKDVGGTTCLMKACERGDLEMVKSLLKYIDINALDTQHNSALFYSVVGKNPDVTEYLIQNGASIDAINKEGCTALIVATLHQSNVIDVLLKNGANTYIEHSATSYNPLILASKNNFIDLTKKLLKYTDVNFQNSKGYTALIYAAKTGMIETVKLLIENGADPSIVVNDKCISRFIEPHCVIDYISLVIDPFSPIDYEYKKDTMRLFDLNTGCDKTLKYRYLHTYDVLLFSLHSMISDKWLNIF